MKYLLSVLAFVMLSTIACTTKKKGSGVQLETGVSQKLAKYRKATLSEPTYQLFFDIPADKTKPIMATETLRFQWHDSLKAPLQIDFNPLAGAGIHKMIVNGAAVVPNFQKEHLIVDASTLNDGLNQLEFEFQAGDIALNRKEDYLYTLFVPERARTAFPCFDQPDLKATFSLKLTLPDSWEGISNGKLLDSNLTGDRKTLHFAESDTLSTYLFAFAAGNFKSVSQKMDTVTARLLYRENDPAKIKYSLNEIFNFSAKAIRFYEKWTGIDYPFQKIGMAAIPNFQFGGMEHPGSILYQSSSLFLDDGATLDQRNSRSNLMAHELAHMWFGDLVTMRWFDDVWMKEVFANFMADKCTGPGSNDADFNQKFLIDHYPGAFSEDRTLGAAPIRRPLDNLSNAGMLYGNNIYHKAPIMMRQLEKLIGPTAFQKGVRLYLRKYAGSNASWPDLIEILDDQSPIDLVKWNEVWVNQAGRPAFDYTLTTENGRIKQLIVLQKPEFDASDRTGTKEGTTPNITKVWPQVYDIELYYANGVKRIGIRDNSAKMEIKAASGLPEPLFILWNATGSGYGLWPSGALTAAHIRQIKAPLGRASAYINTYEQLLAGSKSQSPAALLKTYLNCLGFENSELNVKLLTGYITDIFWEYLPAAARTKVTSELEAGLWNAISLPSSGGIKKELFNTYTKVFTSEQALQRLKRIWQQRLPQPIKGIALYEEDYASLALQLALRTADNGNLLKEALSSISQPDRRAAFKIIMQAVSSDPKIRNRFFEGLNKRENRGSEAAIIKALYYLNHPLRQPESEKYLKPSLDLLEEIQQTGAIFMPKNWLTATFSYYQSPAAYKIVQQFLEDHPDYNPMLKDKILQATDPLRRSLLLNQK